LNHYTRRRYFTVWTVAWLFYALWLTLNLMTLEPPPLPGATAKKLEIDWVLAVKQVCISFAAVFLLWGSVRFLGMRVRQMLMGFFLVFLLVWTLAGFSCFKESSLLLFTLPVFLLIGGSSGVAAYGFWLYRRRRDYMGAGLLSVGFLLWGSYLASYPFVQSTNLLASTSFFISAVLQLFIAVSMIILVLEQLRFVNQRRAQNRIRLQQAEKSMLQHRMTSTEDRYRTLFEQASEAIVIAATEDLRLLEANQAAERLLGIRQTDVGRLSLVMFCQVANLRDRPPGTGEEWFRYICDQSPINLVRKNGGQAVIEANGAVIDLAGRPAYQFFLKELTDQSRLEYQLRQAEKYSALGQMISGVAHELNNPLSVINGYLELILAHHTLPATTKTALTKVVQESNRATRLIRNFLNFAREQPGQRRMVDINDYVHRLVELRKFDFSVGNVQLLQELDPQLPHTLADPDQVQQVLVNLVNNALQAMLETPGPHTLRIQTKRQGKSVAILVEDDGPGVPKELETRIFEPLFTTKEPGIGTGLGLSIAHSIMAEHQGKILYHRSSLGGAGFTVEFPLITPANIESYCGGSSEAAVESAPGPSWKGTRVLVVDDEKPVADLLGEMLTSLGCQTSICTDARKALEELRQSSFDLIVTDIRMPDMDGREFFKQAIEEKPDLTGRFVLFTGDVVNAETQAFLKQANCPYLTKPFELNQVQRLIRDVLCQQHQNALEKSQLA
ncbi:MAG TPA: response regulator, partial [Candidatus Paceibacterota bacterium]|nr:response regulator [Candidatus Paceibacterota bacterium]